MTDKISTLIDAEPHASGQDAPLKDLLNDETARRTWQRYHLIGDIIRQQHRGVTKNMLNGVLTSGIRGRIAQEPVRIAPKALSENASTHTRHKIVNARLSNTASGMAIAASLAAIAFFGLNLQNSRNTLDTPAIAQSSPLPTPVLTENTQWRTTQPDSEIDLNTFLVEHGEFTSPSGLNGLIAYAKFVSYDTRR